MRRSLVFAVALLVSASFAADAHARTLDRIVAIAGDHVILLSEVQLRAKPYVALAASQEKDPLALARLTSKALRETCERLIDEALVEDEAKRQHLVVTDDEVDKAIAQVAANNNLTLDALYAEAAKQGYDAATYHAEISHTIIEWKLVQIRTRTSDEKVLEGARKDMLVELRSKAYVEDRLTP